MPTLHRLFPWLLTLPLVACAAPDSTPTADADSPSIASETPAQTLPSPTAAVDPDLKNPEPKLTVIAEGLTHPWAVALLPDGNFLVSERGGTLRRISENGELSEPILGVPEVFAHGQGGLLDVVLAPDFRNTQRIYFSFSEPGEEGTAGTSVAYATLEAGQLSDVQIIYRQEPKVETDKHFGSRLAFDQHGHIFISQGERTLRMMAQELDTLQGKLVRLNLDGSIPKDNPFIGQKDARPEIWSYGHRNSQGLAMDPRTDKLWESEHGPRGGDEINLPQAGKNYGWPLATHGIDYSGQTIPEAGGKYREGTETPHHVFEVSPGLSGMAFYTGHPGNPWNNSLFLGALAQRNLIRLQLEGDAIVGEERLLTELKERIRDVRTGFDGNIYVLTDSENGRLLKLEPPRS